VATIREDLGLEEASRCRLQLHDFSLGGLKAESPVRLKVNERLRVRIGFNGVHTPLELTGRVRHCRRLQDRYRVGIQFCQTGDEPAGSPWRQLPRLFSVAYRGGRRPQEPEALEALDSR
jgi:hypothetical protein